MKNFQLVELLEEVLGSGHPSYKDNYALPCPNCGHHDNLEVKLTDFRFHCWGCNKVAGRNLHYLLKLGRASRDQHKKLAEIISNRLYRDSEIVDTPITGVELPEEFIPLFGDRKFNSGDLIPLNYLNKRGVYRTDIEKYKVGYCESGHYANKIILPSYDSRGFLSYFEGRNFSGFSKRRYSAPKKDNDSFVGFEFFLNYDLPLVLVEGWFDAAAVKNNVTYLAGSYISRKLDFDIKSKVSVLIIALDPNKKERSLYIANKYYNLGKEVYLVDLKEGDPSSLGYSRFWSIVNDTKKYTPSILW